MVETEIAIQDIEPNPNNPRKHFDEGYLRELGQDIRKNGLIQPITVRPIGEKYEIVVGDCRYRASKMAGLETIKAIVDDSLTSEEARQVSFRENLHRKDLSAVEEAMFFKEEQDRYGLTQQELADKYEVSQSYVSQALGLLKCSRWVQELIITRVITSKHGRELLRIQRLANEYLDLWVSIHRFFQSKDIGGFPLQPLSHLPDHISSRIGEKGITVGELKDMVDGLKYDIVMRLSQDAAPEHGIFRGFSTEKKPAEINERDLLFACRYASKNNLWGDKGEV